ncbi:Fcf1-domain-containing protein [Xylariaceae sp. FL0804]|nr:Fcf1-domain-containing protein [Xylariaceae sp. FL0804]
MRAKRSKAYKKLMGQYALTFGFREPFQVLMDASFILTATQCKMDLVHMLEITLHGKVKPMITQCCMRHLYNRKSEPSVSEAIEAAKLFERRRCGHHPSDYPEPLPEIECLSSVVDPKDTGVNKFRYCCALNEDEARAEIRAIPGTPLLYIKRSVLIMEPISTVSAKARSRDEKSKFRAELKPAAGSGKRKRVASEADEEGDGDSTQQSAGATKPDKKAKKKAYGPKQPNPLSVKKRKKSEPSAGEGVIPRTHKTEENSIETLGAEGPPEVDRRAATDNDGEEETQKRKRRRKHKSKSAGAADKVDEAPIPATED